VNLTGQPVRQKTLKADKPARKRMRRHRVASPQIEVDYMGWVKCLSCAVCGRSGPSDARHVYHDRFSQSKSSNYSTIPLCKMHHQDGPDAIHKNKRQWRELHGPDWSYVETTRREVEGLSGVAFPYSDK